LFGVSGDWLIIGKADRILEVRGKATQLAFAQSLNIAKSTLIRYEKEERLPDAEVIARICERHHIDYTWLITGRGSRTEAERYVKYSPV
jgi:transcriptional regulator with XRE-family HTH domain